MIRLFSLLCISIISCFTLSAQDNFESDRDINSSISGRNGIRFSSNDSLFTLQLRFRMQNRFSYTTRSLDDLKSDKTELMVRRLRLRFNGKMGSDRLFYAIQLGFAIEDMDGDIDQLSNIIRDALVEYKLTPFFTVGFGQSKLPGNRERINSSSELQLVDRSLMNRTLNIDRDFGTFFRFNLGKNIQRLKLTAAISSGSGRNLNLPKDGFCYSGRIEWLPFGEFTSGGDYLQGDVFREPSPKLSLAAATSFNRNALRTGSQIGEQLAEPRDMFTSFADLIFKYKGLGIIGEYGFRDHTGSGLSFPAGSPPLYIFRGHGYTTQVSWCNARRYEMVFRLSEIRAMGVVRQFISDKREIALGLNRYLNAHRVKIQGDVSYITDFGSTWMNQAERWMLRFQVEIGI